MDYVLKIKKEKGCMSLYKVRKFISYFALVLLLLQTILSTPLSASANGLETSEAVTSEEVVEQTAEVEEPVLEESTPVVEEEKTTVEPTEEKVEVTSPTTIKKTPIKKEIIKTEKPQQEAIPSEKEEKKIQTKAARSYDGKDQTSLLHGININYRVFHGTEWENIILNNVVVPNPPVVTVGNRIQFEYFWNLSKAALKQITVNDYFSFDLPNANFLINDTKEIQLLNKNQVLIGYWKIENGKILFRLNEVALSKEGIENGTFKATGDATKAGDDISYTVTEGVTLPPITVVPGVNNNEKPNDIKVPLLKMGNQRENANELVWTNYVNYPNEEARYNGGTPTTLNNAFFIDELTDGQELKEARIEAVTHTATSDGKMSMQKMDWVNVKDLAIEINKTNETSLSQFKATLKATGKFSYGMYDNTFVIYFGNLPGSGIKINEYFLNNTLETRLTNLIAAGKLTEAAAQHTRDYYNKRQDVIAFGVTLITYVDGKDRDFKNIATLESDDGSNTSDEYVIHYQNVDGSASTLDPGFLKIEKTDDREKPLEGVQFKLQLKNASGVYEDYTHHTGEKVFTTNAEGKILVKDLSYGDYKVIEVKGLTGYGKPVFTPSDEFTVASDDVEGDLITVENKKLTSLSVEKVWDDKNDFDKIRPDSITVELLESGFPTNYKIDLNKSNNWKHTWDDLPFYTSIGKEANYTVKEIDVPSGYETSVKVTGSNHVITNVHIPKSIEVGGTKIWDDKDDANGARPESITVNLLANGELVESMKVTAETEWTYEFANLPEKENGEEIIYTVTEDTIEDYTPEYDGFDIINHYTPGKTGATVTKFWDDDNDSEGSRPDSIQAQLYADGKKVGKPVELDDANQWTYTWTNLNDQFTYTVKEVAVPKDYKVTVDNEDHGNLLMTNTHTPEGEVPPGGDGNPPGDTDGPDDKPNKPDTPGTNTNTPGGGGSYTPGEGPNNPSKNPLNWILPQTGDQSTLPITILGSLLLLGAWRLLRNRSNSMS